MVIMLLKRLIYAFVVLSFVFVGTPVPTMAKEMPCPMMKMHSEMQKSTMQSDMSDMKMDMKDCDKCPKSTEKKQAEKTKKGGCCDDQACNAKCAALSSAGGQLFFGWCETRGRFVFSASSRAGCGELFEHSWFE